MWYINVKNIIKNVNLTVGVYDRESGVRFWPY